MPFALSRVLTDASKAMETKITVSNNPTIIIVMPVESGWYNNIGIPAPMNQASDKAEVKPVKHLTTASFFLSAG